MPLIIPANTLSGGYTIDNSIRFNDGDSPSLHITPSSETNKQTWTWSAWFKRSNITSAMNLWTAGNDVNNRCHFDINSSGTFQVEAKNGGSEVCKLENAGGMVLNDSSAWYHLVWRVDTTQGTAGNRVRVYINGSELTFTGTANQPSQSTNFEINVNSTLHAIGRRTWETSNYFDGYLAEVHFADGQSYAPTVFGETNDNGVWIPKDCKADITYGTNGYFLEFKQTGTSQNSSGIGADTSGEDNHFAVSNFAATDITTDTPTNNFCTLNHLANSSYTTLSEGNLKTTGNSSSNNGNTESTMAVANGKWYWEHKMTTSASPYYPTTGALKPETVGRLLNGGTNGMVGVVTDSVGYEFDGDRRISNTSTDDHFDALSNGDILGIALDMDNGAVYFSRNGTWQNSSDPTSGASKTNAAHTWTADGRYMMPATASYNSSVAEINFGNPPFSISSGNSDGAGYGNFEYAVPSGYYSLCTKNLAEYG